MMLRTSLNRASPFACAGQRHRCSAVMAQPYERVYNFSAGPAMLPVDVLEQCRDDILNWQGSGMSVMEMSHRGKEFIGIATEAQNDLKQLLGIPDNYKVLFMQGGASMQFSTVPLNLVSKEETIDYVVTGSWSKKAYAEGERFCNANLAAKGDNKSIPEISSWAVSESSKYVHYCDNETIQGVEFIGNIDVGDKLLVGDFSSDFLSKPVDVSKYGVLYADRFHPFGSTYVKLPRRVEEYLVSSDKEIFRRACSHSINCRNLFDSCAPAGVQKNVGPAGVAVVIVRDDLLGNARDECPTMCNYTVMAESDSMYNTPPCWSMYVCGLVFKKLLKEGGLSAMEQRNNAKAKILYDAIEASGGFYNSPVELSSRSRMNVPFTIPSDAALEAEFIKEASAAGLKTLKGHRSVGGMRASIYNAMPSEGCDALAKFMKEFQAKHT